MECMSESLLSETVNSDFNTRFLLAQLHIDSLAQEPTVGHVKLALQNLPTGLDKTYEQAIERIERQGENFKRLAKKVLSWAVHAKRILSITELLHAVAVQSGKPNLDGKFIPSIEVVGSICAGLVTIDTQSDIFRLVHYTTQEYFEKTSIDWFANAETDIMVTCVTYLSFKTFESGFCRTDEEFEKRLQLYPLYHYAAQNWGYHARTASLEKEQLILDFLWNEAKVCASIQALMAFKTSWGNAGYSQRVPKQMIGLHLAAYFGATTVITALLQDTHLPDVEDLQGRTPLLWAAEQGHAAVVKLLLKKGAKLESKDIYGRSPLSWAVEMGHAAVVKLLLEKGAKLGSKDIYGQTPLLWAIKNEHEVVAKLLLQKGAKLESKDNEGRTSLFWAAECGYEAVVKLLLDKGAKTESKDNRYGQTPLSWAAKSGNETVVKLLLEKGAETESKDIYGQTPLLWAAKNGHEVVVKLLINEGAEMESKDNGYGQTPLSWAAERGYEEVVRLLLKAGAELESKDNKYGRTPLSKAAERGHETVVKILLIKGAALESQDISGKTPLDWAKQKGHVVVVKLLFEGVVAEPSDNGLLEFGDEELGPGDEELESGDEESGDEELDFMDEDYG